MNARRASLAVLCLAVLLALIPEVFATDEWYNSSWHFRQRYEFNASSYSREDWPFELQINFTQLLQQAGSSNLSFDNNSLRVFEYNSSGSLLYEVPHQFDIATNYASENNAIGELVFIMNGTTLPFESRIYYVYFDALANGQKTSATYSTALTYYWDGEEFNVNNTGFQWYLDTMRGENTSGIYRVVGPVIEIFNAASDERTFEYSQYTNESSNFSFAAANNASFVAGPVRITATLIGEEAYWNSTNSTTGEAILTKNYKFYNLGQWIKIEQNYTGTSSSSIIRSSTLSGSIAFDAERAFGATYVAQDNTTDPFSWVHSSDAFNSFGVGIINLNESNTQNYVSSRGDNLGRIGVNLSTLTLTPADSISEVAIMRFSDTAGELTNLRNLSSSFLEGIIIDASTAEEWKVNSSVRANFTFYNRNETVFVILNITDDTYNFTSTANATIDNGTVSPSDDFNLTLYDDGLHGDLAAGDKIFANNFTLDLNDTLGEWSITSRVYGADQLLLSSNTSGFNVTSIYNMSAFVTNFFGLASRLVNASLLLYNYRQDTPIPNAALTCNYALNTSIDFGNGTYAISFQAPPSPGAFGLFCNASKAGNLGTSSANFSSEAAQTSAIILHSPLVFAATNVGLYTNQNFSLQVNATNIGNGSANLANITLSLPANWTASNLTFYCSNVSVGNTCVSNFTITIFNGTVPGNYTINSTFNWQNPDASLYSNTSNSTVIVASNPLLNVTESFLYNIVGPGSIKIIGNFTIDSIGNDALQNIAFNVSGFPNFNFTFIPINVSSLSASSSLSIQVNVSVPSSQNSGDYFGILDITSANGGNDSLLLNLTISGANVSINASPLTFIADNITQTQNQSFSLQVNLTNTGNATSFATNISLQLPSGIASDSVLVSCYNLTVGANCTGNFIVTVLNATAPGTYLVNASAVWEDIDVAISTNTSIINISVLSNPLLEISEAVLSGNATHGNATLVGNFTILSNGNDALQNITFNLSGLDNYSMVFSPSNISNLSAGLQQTVIINATIPFAYDPGAENGTINITAENDGSANLTLQVLVSVDRDWAMDQTFCEKTESPDWGEVCAIAINNTGNTFINFSITPFSANYTAVNDANFTIPKQSIYLLNITYNVSGVAKQPYNSTYLILANSTSSIPSSRTLLVSLVPFSTLIVVLEVTPQIIQNNETITLNVNVTDANAIGIKNVTANITLPNSTSDIVNLFMINSIYNVSGNLTQWRAVYPNVTGSTNLAGNYTVVINAFDNLDINGTANGTFYAYPSLQLTLQTLSSSYAKGSTASIYYRARDLGGSPLVGTNVTLTVKTPSNVLAFNNSYTAAVSGIVEPLPTFSIPSDAEAGTWSLYAYTIYNDTNASVLLSDTSNTTFQVANDSSSNVTFSGLLTDFKSSDLYFGGDTVELAISVYDVNGAPVDPDSMNITIVAPNESIYSVINFSQINRSSTGLYYYKFVVQNDAPSGVYRAELNASRGQYTTRNLALFRISSSLFADVETSFVWYPASVMTFRMVVYTGDGMLIDPTSLALTVIDPAGNTYFSVGISSMTKQATGYYVYNHAMGVNTSTGNYYTQLNATRDTSSTIKIKPFRVSQGGPYDIRFELLDNEVYPGEYLDFQAVLENKGEVTQDVTLEYWVSDGVKTWYYGSEAILTPAFQNTTAIRSAYIFTSQPAGPYTLYGRVTYDLIKPPIDISYAFTVNALPQATPAPTSPPGTVPTTTTPPSVPLASATPSISPPQVQDYSGMQIISYPDEVAIQAGETKYPKIQVRNTGLVPLHNVTITLAGIPLSWLEVLPSRVNALAPGDTATFVLKITAPENEPTSIRKVRALALSAERKEEVRFDVAIFESRVALIEHQIRRLKERAQELAADTEEAEKVGKEVKQVWETIDQVQKYIAEAEDFLRQEQIDDAYSSTQIADTLLAKGTALLIAAPFAPPTYAQLPDWITLALGVIGTGMGILVFWFIRRRKKKKPEEAKEQPSVLEKVSGVLEKTDKPSLQREKKKVSRALRLLEDELTDGTISQSAYNELRKRYDRKLIEIDKKLEKAP